MYKRTFETVCGSPCIYLPLRESVTLIPLFFGYDTFSVRSFVKRKDGRNMDFDQVQCGRESTSTLMRLRSESG